MHEGLVQMESLVKAVHPVTSEDWAAFSALWTPFAAKRKQIITAAGDTEKYLYFVVEGVQRVVYFDDQEREATIVFTYPPSFGGVLDAFLQQQPSRYFYETLTPSVFLRAPYIELQPLMERNHNIQQVIRKGVTGALSGVLERVVELQCYTAEEKFKKLLHRSPHMLQLVPHKYLANYLGIDPTNFSKLINKVRI